MTADHRWLHRHTDPYGVDPARTATVELTPRQWTRILLDERAPPCSQFLTQYVLIQLPLSDHYPDDRIAVSATPREASLLTAVLRDYDTRGY